MKPIGGYPELDLPASTHVFHTDAWALASGRSCISEILQRKRPTRAYIPFYCCDSVMQPFRDLGIRVEHYSIGEDLLPASPPTPSANEILFLIDLFGLCEFDTTYFSTFSDSIVYDCSHAFFRKPSASCWMFNSARKFFGVPDGAYLYMPADQARRPLPRNCPSWNHLILRLEGKLDEGYHQFKQAEKAITCSVLEISRGSERLLSLINYGERYTRRQKLYEIYHQELQPTNQLHISIRDNQAPLYYPYLPPTAIRHEELHTRSLFVPRLWADVLTRNGNPFSFERHLAQNLLPLPITDMMTISDAISVCDQIKSLA